MQELFIFDLRRGNTSQRNRTTVVFCPDPLINPAILKDNLKEHFETCLPPDKLLLIGTAGAKERMHEVAAAEELQTALKHMTRWTDPPQVETVCQGNNGQFTRYDGHELPQTITRDIAQSGLFQLFEHRGGLLQCGPGFHYRKPSGAHCDKFIRTANVLVHGAETAFISFWLLPHLTVDVGYIYTDTAAITSLAYALILLKRQLDPAFPAPVITSFGSYGGMESTRFTEPALVIISASTSGHLEDILVNQRHISRKNIITIYGLGKLHAAARVLCDLTDHGITPVENHNSKTCPLCRRSVPLIGITGEQFLPETPVVRSELLTVNHAPHWLKKFIGDFVERDIVRCNYPSVPADTPVRHVYFNIAPIYNGTLEANEFTRTLDRLILQSTPAALQRIVCLNDAASKALAQRVLTLTTTFRKEPVDIKIIPARDLYKMQQELTAYDGATLVVASAIVTGRSLLAISQLLRRMQKNGLIHYLIGLGKTTGPERYKDIKTNAQYGESAGDYDFRTVANIHLPTDSFVRDTPWDEERKHLVRMEELFQDKPEYVELLANRQNALNIEEKDGGLRRQLFWPAPTGKTLQLRHGFAFWSPGYHPEKVSQAEVYFTMLSVLHAAREGHTGGAAWVQHEHERVILSPFNFTRFNDGIIQASLLRAAHPAELDYTVKDDHSATMMGVLEHLVTHFDNDTGEATIEILLALATEKL